MNQLFITTIRYSKTLENGMTKTVSEQYLVDAMSFTEAEARIIEEMQSCIGGEFAVSQIVKPRISEFFETTDADADKYYKFKVQYLVINAQTGTESKTSQFMLVRAGSFDDALRRFRDAMRGTTADYTILSVAETPIMDYFPYVAK